MKKPAQSPKTEDQILSELKAQLTGLRGAHFVSDHLSHARLRLETDAASEVERVHALSKGTMIAILREAISDSLKTPPAPTA